MSIQVCYILVFAIIFRVTATDGAAIFLTSKQAPTCPNEVASYRCVATNGTQLAWRVSIPGAADNAVTIVFDDSSSVRSIESQLNGLVWAVLVERTSNDFESILTIRPSPSIPSAIIECITSDGAKDFANYTVITTGQPSEVTGLDFVAVTGNVSWESPQVGLTLAFYEVHVIGRGLLQDRKYKVLEPFAYYVDSSMFESVNVTIENRCGQRSQSAHISLPEKSYGANGCTTNIIIALFVGIILGALVLLLAEILVMSCVKMCYKVTICGCGSYDRESQNTEPFSIIITFRGYA